MYSVKLIKIGIRVLLVNNVRMRLIAFSRYIPQRFNKVLLIVALYKSIQTVTIAQCHIRIALVILNCPTIVTLSDFIFACSVLSSISIPILDMKSGRC